MKVDVFTFGEVMLRLSVPPGESLLTVPSLEVHIGGAEANVAVALAGLGRKVVMASQLPDNTLGHRVLSSLAGAGVDCSNVRVVDDARLGIYFVDLLSPPQVTSIIYDRAHSAVCSMTPEDIDWDAVSSAKIVHLTGITPALSPSCERTMIALAENVSGTSTLSFDVNYRAKLWAPDQAAKTLSRYLRFADLVVCAIEDAELLFSTSADPGSAATQLADEYEIPRVVVTSGSSGVWWIDHDTSGHLEAIPVAIVDRLGAGDALTAGVLDGVLDGELVSGIERGIALAAVALTTKGDQIRIPRAELDSLLVRSSRSVDR